MHSTTPLPLVPCRSALRQHTKDKTHLRKCSSGLQFDIELIEGQARSKSTHYFMLKDPTRLPPAMAVAALIEPKDPLESSIGMQVSVVGGWMGPSTQRTSTHLGWVVCCPGWFVLLILPCQPDSTLLRAGSAVLLTGRQALD